MLPGSTDDIPRKLPTQRHPSNRLVIITLICVTFPVELVFLGILRAFGWLRFPILFVLFSIVFFCIAVRVFLFIFTFRIYQHFVP